MGGSTPRWYPADTFFAEPHVRYRTAAAVCFVAAIVAASAIYYRPVALFEVATRAGLVLAGFERGVVSSMAGPVAYFESGTGPTVVLLHGLQDQAGGWARIAPQLDDTHRVLIPDLLGHGGSGPLSGDIHPRQGVDQVWALLESRCKGQRVTLVGNSMGGGVALAFALQHPEYVERLVLLNSAGMKMEIDEPRFLPRDVDDVRTTMRAILASEPPPEFVLRDVARNAHEGPTARLWPALSDSALFLDADVPRINAPTAVVWGTADGLIPIETGRRLANAIPGSTFHSIEGCGHSPQVTCPAELMEILGPLLRSR